MENATTFTSETQKLGTSLMDQKLSRNPGKIAMIVFGCAIAGGIVYAGLKLGSDLAYHSLSDGGPYVLLGVALLIALGFEFVNGFHDTANAVATVIYTHSLSRTSRWSGRACGTFRACWFLGRGRVRHRVAAAGRADPAGRLAPASRWCSRC